MNTTNLPGGEEHGIGFRLNEPALGLGLTGKVDLSAVYRENCAFLLREPAHDCRADHPSVTGNENAPVCQFKRRRQGHAKELGLRLTADRISIARQALRTRALLGARHDRPFPSTLDFNPGSV